LIFGKDDAALDAARDALVGRATVVREERAMPRTQSKEHFGFRDGISQPALFGDPATPLPGQDVLQPGEIILGYRNEYGCLPISPTVAATVRGADALPAMGERRDLGRNGTYLVFRKLAQDVAGFWRWIDAQAHVGEPEWLAARCMGRWPSGAPLALSPHRDDAALGADTRRNNLFGFDHDRAGLGCPLGSHVRRANPRDGHPAIPDPEESQRVVNRHRIVRRGRPYGPSLAQPRGGVDDGIDRGLLFVALNASIKRQFEFVQQTWLTNEKFAGLDDDKDPMVGDNDGTGFMTIPRDPLRLRLQGVPRFVTVRGGGYFFLPGMRTLRFLAGVA
jgi:Dyp-type peroxidase family